MFELENLSRNLFGECCSTDFNNNNPFNYGHLENQSQYQEIASIDGVKPYHTVTKISRSDREAGSFSDLSSKMVIIMTILLCLFGIITIVEEGTGSTTSFPRYPVVNSSELNKSYGPLQTSSPQVVFSMSSSPELSPTSVQPASAISGISSSLSPLKSLKNHVNSSAADFDVPMNIAAIGTTSSVGLSDVSNSKDEGIMCELSEHLDMPKRVIGWKCNDEEAALPPCQWSGVACDKNHRVVVLEMKSSSIRGSLPPSIDKLSHLERLNFHDNLITGSIPPSIAKIKNLREINLSDNKLWGGVPPKLGKLSKLESLYLSNNSLTGKLPRVFDKPPFRISSMDFSGNKITGPIPPVFGKISTLRSLLLHDNVLR